ncbi:Uma2 family endonuclease [Streptomyces sp. NBC_01102]|uniref:Uma2 family endonuclease n=1 Tax=unclassified Streptomyces TaxID=2593676 RepID=UPI00386C11F6|nr:Uma2 family endonuclease [Streptomyces sp. NBC_01102]
MAVGRHEEQMTTVRSELTIGEAAEQAARSLPGHRVEILQGRLTVTPPADGSHAPALSWLSEEFGVGARGVGLRLVQAVGLWLSTGPDDYAIPDLAVVELRFP